MNHALAFSLPPLTWPCFVAAVVFSTMASVPSSSWKQDAPLPEPTPAVAAPIREAGKAARARAVCVSCGVVESIRRFEPVGDLPAGYEFTVRMRDGSARVSSIASSNKWLVGDTIMLIGGGPD